MRTGTGVETRYAYEPTRRFLAGIDTGVHGDRAVRRHHSTARPLQRLRYPYDKVGNVRDVVNRLYDSAGDTNVNQLGPPTANNVPGPSQHAYTYDGHYRLIGGRRRTSTEGAPVLTYATDYAANGNLVSKRQVTTTTSTTEQRQAAAAAATATARATDDQRRVHDRADVRVEHRLRWRLVQPGPRDDVHHRRR